MILQKLANFKANLILKRKKKEWEGNRYKSTAQEGWYYAMMDETKLPFSLQMVGHMDYNWGTFKQRFQLYLTTAVSIAEMPDKWKIALLLTTARSPAIDSLNIFTYTFLLLSEENVSIQRWFLWGFDVCCSWRGMRHRQRCLQQQGKAMGRKSDAFVTDQRQSKLWPQKLGQGQESKGRSKRPILWPQQDEHQGRQAARLPEVVSCGGLGSSCAGALLPAWFKWNQMLPIPGVCTSPFILLPLGPAPVTG